MQSGDLREKLHINVQIASANVKLENCLRCLLFHDPGLKTSK